MAELDSTQQIILEEIQDIDFGIIGDIVDTAGGILDAILHPISTLQSHITDEILEGLSTTVSQLIRDILNLLDSGFIHATEPTFSSWNVYIGTDVRDSIIRGCQLFGCGLIIILISCFIIQLMMNPQKQRNTPWGVMGKTLVAILAIYSTPSIISIITDTADSLQYYIYTYSEECFSFSDMLALSSRDGAVTILGVAVTGFLCPLLPFLFIIIAFIVAWPLFKQFFRYLVEMIERYIIFCILLCLFPAAVATIILDSTDNIFKSYLRMLGSQLFLLLTNGIFLKGFVAIILTGKLNSIPAYIFALGYLRIIQRLDSYLNAMGLNVAQTSGGVMDSIGGAVRSIGNGFRRLDHSRQSVGSGMKALGASNGNQKLFNAGSIIGANAKTGVPTSQKLDKDFLNSSINAGVNSVNMNPDSSAHMISQYMQDPLSNAKTLNAISSDSLASGLNYMTNLDGIDNVSVGNKSIGFDALGEDGDMKHFSLSSTDDGLGLELQNGLYLNTGNTLGDGESISGSYDRVLQDTGCLGLDRQTDIDRNILGGELTAYQNGRYTMINDNTGSSAFMIDRDKNMVLQPSPILSKNENGEMRISDSTSSRIIEDVKKAYPSYDVTSSRVRYDSKSKTAYLNVQKHGEDKTRKLYVQDMVSRDTNMPETYNRTSRRYSANGGKHRTGYVYGLAKEYNRTGKKSNRMM